MTLTPGCVRGALQIRIPVLAVVDAGEAISAVLDLVIRAEQSRR